MDDLTSEFLPVVDDPEQVAQLYALLRDHCHDLRGKLGEYRMAEYMARRSGVVHPGSEAALGEFEVRFGELVRFLDDLQMICRPMTPNPSGVSIGEILNEMHRRWATELAHAGRSLRWIAPNGPPEGCLDAFLLGHALDSFVSWRAEVAVGGDGVRARWAAESRGLRLLWEEPDVVPKPSITNLPCLAPVLLGRVLRAHGGTLSLDDRNGFRLELSLPIDGMETTYSTRPAPSRRLTRDLAEDRVASRLH